MIVTLAIANELGLINNHKQVCIVDHHLALDALGFLSLGELHEEEVKKHNLKVGRTRM
jgi:hypothetical protein